MDSLDHRITELRTEIERIKGVLLVTANESERFQLQERMRACLGKSLALIGQRIESQFASIVLTLHDQDIGDRP